MNLDRQRIRSGPIQVFTAAKDLVSDKYWLFVGITVLASFIGTAIPLYPLLGAMAYGVFLALRTQERGKEVRFDQLFKGFDKLGETVVPSLLYGGIMLFVLLLTMVPFIIVGVAMAESGQEELGPFVMLLGYATMPFTSALIWAPFAFTFQLILDREMSGMAAVAESWRATRENFLKVFTVSFLAVLLYGLGIALCCLGWILTLPLIAGAQWIMYREIYPDLGLGKDAEQWARETEIHPEGPPRQDWSSESEG